MCSSDLRRSERHGWWTLRGERFEVVFLGPPTSGLPDLLERLGSWLGGQAPGATDAEAQAVWRVQRRLAALVEHLRARPLAGWSVTQVAWATGGLDVRWQGDGGSVLLHVRQSPGDLRPQFGHSADHVDPGALAAFSRALGERLRQLSTGVSTPV